MILAAGLGTRLRPLTDRTPKALIEVGGVPMLERVARRLTRAGATRLIVNVHHHADQIRRFIEAKDGFGVETLISEEAEQPLETGGGLRRAAPLFRRDAPFFVHNADVLSDLDLGALYHTHLTTGTLATLAVKALQTPRYLLFDRNGLFGYGNAATGYEHHCRTPAGPPARFDFCGVQVLSPRFFDLLTEAGVFSIISPYLRLSRAGEAIRAFDVGDVPCLDIGQPEMLEQARRLHPSTPAP